MIDNATYLPDLVRDSQLPTTITDGITTHAHRFSDPESNRRLRNVHVQWRREGKVGEGGYGSVHIERRISGPRLNQPKVRAVKRIRHARHHSFIDELVAAAKFSYPQYECCFVKSYGWYEDDESLYIAMEYLELGDLHQYVSNSPLISEVDAAIITWQILDGLSLMHDHNFSHRDIKPQNILIKSTAPWWVKIGDFGISKRLEEQEGNTTSSVKGTLHYMAPELFFFGPQDTDHEAACDYYKADIWAAGCITYFLLTKKHPSLNLRAMISECYGKPPLSTSGLSKHSVPEAARSFVAALLNVDPKEWPAAEEALEHEWLQAHYEEPLDDEMDEGLLSRHESRRTSRKSIRRKRHTGTSDSTAPASAAWTTRTAEVPVPPLPERYTFFVDDQAQEALDEEIEEQSSETQIKIRKHDSTQARNDDCHSLARDRTTGNEIGEEITQSTGKQLWEETAAMNMAKAEARRGKAQSPISSRNASVPRLSLSLNTDESESLSFQYKAILEKIINESEIEPKRSRVTGGRTADEKGLVAQADDIPFNDQLNVETSLESLDEGAASCPCSVVPAPSDKIEESQEAIVEALMDEVQSDEKHHSILVSGDTEDADDLRSTRNSGTETISKRRSKTLPTRWDSLHISRARGLAKDLPHHEGILESPLEGVFFKLPLHSHSAESLPLTPTHPAVSQQHVYTGPRHRVTQSAGSVPSKLTDTPEHSIPATAKIHAIPNRTKSFPPTEVSVFSPFSDRPGTSPSEPGSASIHRASTPAAEYHEGLERCEDLEDRSLAPNRIPASRILAARLPQASFHELPTQAPDRPPPPPPEILESSTGLQNLLLSGNREPTRSTSLDQSRSDILLPNGLFCERRVKTERLPSSQNSFQRTLKKIKGHVKWQRAHQWKWN